MFDTCRWHNEPRDWSLENGDLHVTTDAKSDFWRETYYGFTRDSGHVFASAWTGDFTASVRVRARYEQLYDQAGMMVRVDDENWVKAGIELSDGAACIGSVLTVGRSDWATSAYPDNPEDVQLRVTVENGVLRLQYSADGLSWPLLRLAPFPRAASYRVGPMCCTPERSGLKVLFSDFQIGPPLGKALHDLT